MLRHPSGPAYRGHLAHRRERPSSACSGAVCRSSLDSASGSLAPQPVEAVVKSGELRNRVGVGIRHLDIGDLPPRECSLDLVAARRSGQRPPPAGSEGVEDQGSVGGRGSGQLPAHCAALLIVEPVEGAGVRRTPTRSMRGDCRAFRERGVGRLEVRVLLGPSPVRQTSRADGGRAHNPGDADRAGRRGARERRVERCEGAVRAGAAGLGVSRGAGGPGNRGVFLDETILALHARERAYAGYRAAGRRGAGGDRARLGLSGSRRASRRRRMAVTARRLLAGCGPTRERGWLALREARVRAAGGCAAGAEMTAIALDGVAQVSQGEIAAGMARLDEATTAATAGEMRDPIAIDFSCCYLIFACERVRDLERGGQWCERGAGMVGILRRARRGRLGPPLRPQTNGREPRAASLLARALRRAVRDLPCANTGIVDRRDVRCAEQERSIGGERERPPWPHDPHRPPSPAYLFTCEGADEPGAGMRPWTPVGGKSATCAVNRFCAAANADLRRLRCRFERSWRSSSGAGTRASRAGIPHEDWDPRFPCPNDRR